MVSYFNWANDQAVRKNAIHTDPISWLNHKEWFVNRLNDPNSHLYVLDAAGLSVGHIRFEVENNVARIDYSLDKLVRGRGWGARLVSLGSKLLQKTEPVQLLAEVKADNHASRLVFLHLGFKVTECNDSCLVFRRALEYLND